MVVRAPFWTLVSSAAAFATDISRIATTDHNFTAAAVSGAVSTTAHTPRRCLARAFLLPLTSPQHFPTYRLDDTAAETRTHGTYMTVYTLAAGCGRLVPDTGLGCQALQHATYGRPRLADAPFWPSPVSNVDVGLPSLLVRVLVVKPVPGTEPGDAAGYRTNDMVIMQTGLRGSRCKTRCVRVVVNLATV